MLRNIAESDFINTIRGCGVVPFYLIELFLLRNMLN